MMHLKLYEQYTNLEVLSDEDIFGKQKKDLILGVNAGKFYIIYNPIFHKNLYINNMNDYFIYDDDKDSYPISFNAAIFKMGVCPNEDSEIVFNINKAFISVRWKRLNPDIKNRIEL